MGQIIEKVQKMDKISVGLELLMDDLQHYYEADFSEEWRITCFNRLAEIRNDCHELKLEITKLLEKIQGLITEPFDIQRYNTICTFLQKTRDIFYKLSLYNIHSEDTYKEECLENYYGTQYDKRVLLVYILHPFIFEDMVPEHTNQVEARIIAETLSEKGYNVDLVNTRYNKKLMKESMIS